PAALAATAPATTAGPPGAPAAAGAVGDAVPLAAAAAAREHGAAMFKGPDGSERGTVILTEGPSGVLIGLELTGLAPGWHAVHVHAKADCSDPAFTSAGGHVNHATAKPHGLLNPAGPDAGDLPNIMAGPDGK